MRKLPFIIGMQYENWEFDLDILETERHDKYRYNKNDIPILFNMKVLDIYLFFDLDILFKVKIVLKSQNSVHEFVKLEQNIKNEIKENKNKLIIESSLHKICVTIIDKNYF